MVRIPIGHGCPLVCLVFILGAPVVAADPIPVHSLIVDIDYRVDEAAEPLDSVELWFTRDRGSTWTRYGKDPDRQSPMAFRAPGEGHYGFFLVLGNETGPSSMPPAVDTKPQLEVFVDTAAPVVQLHPLKPTTILGERTLQIRWTAIDANLTARPIKLEYRTLSGGNWMALTTDPLSNTGRYDWRVPDGLFGAIAVRVSAVDRGGHLSRSEPMKIDPVFARAALAVPIQLSVGSRVGSGVPASVVSAIDPARSVKERAAKLQAEAMEDASRGRYRDGIARLREAVRIDPSSSGSFAEMANMLYRIGDTDRALEAYSLALKREPGMRSALRGSAMIHRLRNDHASAAKDLRTILRHNPKDAEVWMNLGDVAVFQGDEFLARECYTRATKIDPSAFQVVEDARRRLALMADVSRN